MADEDILALLESQRGRKLDKLKTSRVVEKVSKGQKPHKPLQANWTRIGISDRGLI